MKKKKIEKKMFLLEKKQNKCSFSRIKHDQIFEKKKIVLEKQFLLPWRN